MEYGHNVKNTLKNFKISFSWQILEVSNDLITNKEEDGKKEKKKSNRYNIL